MSHDARRDAMRDARSTQPPPPRRFCPRCGAALGALAAPAVAAPAVNGSAGGRRPDASELYCGCCGPVVPAS